MAESEIEFDVPSTPALLDPVLSMFQLPLRAIVHPLGYTVEIATNSPQVVACAKESWGHFQKAFSEPTIQIQIGVLEGSSEECPPIPVCRARDNLVVAIADAENFTVCDLRRGFGFGWVTRSTVADADYFRYYLLEAMVWTMVKSLYLTPLHGALVKFAERGVLLCGDAGAGKSSLAFACARNGWTFLSDDSGCLIRSRRDRLVVGNPYKIRFREEGIELFPELKSQRVAPRPTGEMSIEVNTASMPEISTALMGVVDYIVFLNRRQPDPPCLVPLPKEIALNWFESIISFGERALREAQTASLQRLIEVPIYELRYGDLDWARNRLEALVREDI